MGMKEEYRQLAFDKLNKANEINEPEIAREEYEALLSAPYQAVRIIAAENLGEIKSSESVHLLAILLNDRCPHVSEESASSLAKIRTPEALKKLAEFLFEDTLDRPHHITNAISFFGNKGFSILKEATQSTSTNIRYHALRGLGSTGRDEGRQILENFIGNQSKTSFGGTLSTAAKHGLKTLNRIQNN